MRILFFHYQFPPLGGGYGSYHLLARELVKRGHEVLYVTSRMKGQKRKETVDGIDVLRLFSTRTREDKAGIIDMLSYLLSSFFQLGKVIDRFDPHLSHIFFAIPTGILKLHPALIRRSSVVTCLGSDVPGHNENRYVFLQKALIPLVKLIWKLSDKVVANSEKLKDEIKTISPGQEVKVINNGIDTDQFRPSNENTVNNVLRFLYVGRLVPLKNIDLAIKAVSEVHDRINRKIVFDIVGDGEEEENLKRQAQKEGMAEVVNFIGSVPHSEIHKYHQKTDFFILLSETEGMSYSLMEAMACGAIPIVSEVGGVDELIEVGNNGILKTGGLDNLIEDVVDVIKNKNNIEEIKNKASQTIKDNFNKTTFTQEYINLYDEVI